MICQQNRICIKVSRRGGKIRRTIKLGGTIISKILTNESQVLSFSRPSSSSSPPPSSSSPTPPSSSLLPSSSPPPSSSLPSFFPPHSSFFPLSGLNMVVLKRIAGFPKIFEDNYRVDEGNEMERFLNDTELFMEKEIFILSTLQNWSSLNSPSFLSFFRSIGGPPLTKHDDKTEIWDFVLVGHRGLCGGEGVFMEKNLKFSAIYLDVDLEGEKFGIIAPFVLKLKPNGIFKKNEIVSIFGYNFGNETADIGEVVIDKVRKFTSVFNITPFILLFSSFSF